MDPSFLAVQGAFDREKELLLLLIVHQLDSAAHWPTHKMLGLSQDGGHGM